MYKYINKLKENTSIKDQPYFRLLNQDQMSFETFKYSQVNFYKSVLKFSKPLFVLCSRIDNYEDRLKILENILDEHGNGNLKDTHGNTYKMYLNSLGIGDNKFPESYEHVSCSNFFSEVEKIVSLGNIDKALAMYGIIEDRYTEISSFVAKIVLKNKWIDKENLIHYSTHEELDKYHAKLFYSIIEQRWEKEKSQNQIKKGLNIGNELVLRLFNDLLIKN